MADFEEEKHENISWTPRKGLAEIDKYKIRKELYSYFQERRRKLDIVKTTRTPKGQILDWVPIESQLKGEKKLASPPSESISLKLDNGPRSVKPVRFELEDTKVDRGPEGTVPILRRDIRRLSLQRQLQDHLMKHGHRTYKMFIDEQDSVEVPADGTVHEYCILISMGHMLWSRR